VIARRAAAIAAQAGRPPGDRYWCPMLGQWCAFDLAGFAADGFTLAALAAVEVADETELCVAVCAVPLVAAEATPAAPAPSPAASTPVSISRRTRVAVTVATVLSFPGSS